MKIRVLNLNKTLRDADKVGRIAHLISIRDRICGDDTQAKYDALDRRVARNGIDMKVIYFDDIDTYRFYHGMEHPWIKTKFADGTKEPIFFGPEHAKEIMDFASKVYELDDELVVHCWAGRSRSQAVAYWLNIYFNLMVEKNMDDFLANNGENIFDKIHFNCDVLKVFTQVYGSVAAG